MSDNIDQVVGLELGDDDYIPKPVEPRVLLARIQARLRNTTIPASTNIADSDKTVTQYHFSDLKICQSSYEVHLNNNRVAI